MTASSGISFLAPAKLNISLKVFGRRSDGYHHIRSVMVPVSLYDEVTVEEAPEGIHIEADDPSAPCDASNTCCKAAAAFMRREGVPAGVRIRIVKRIPGEAGLGGGSSDAAATLKGMAVLTGRHLSETAILSLAASVGADVPFFARGGTALAEGAGELLSPVAWSVPFWAVIVKPSFGLSTAEGYKRLRRGAGPQPPRRGLPAFREWRDVVGEVSNDFEEAWSGDHPEIESMKEELTGAGALAAGLTGSGSAVYGLFDSEDSSRRGLGALRRADGRSCFIARNI